MRCVPALNEDQHAESLLRLSHLHRSDTLGLHNVTFTVRLGLELEAITNWTRLAI